MRCRNSSSRRCLPTRAWTVKAIGCNRSYATHCTSMEATSLPLDADPVRKDKVCRACISNRRLLAKSFSAIPYIPIEQYQDGSELAPVEISKTPDEIELHAGWRRCWRLALYETLIKFKKFNMDLSPSNEGTSKPIFSMP